MHEPLVWDTEGFHLGGTRFLAAGLRPGESTSSCFYLRKPKPLVKAYAHLLGRLKPDQVADLGIYDGACAAFIAQFRRPRRLAAIDIMSSFPALDGFIAEQGLEEVVTVHGGVDQGDRAALLAAVGAGLGSDPIDLVVDDASHEYAPTVVSFEALFPLVRPGGLFLIEDWAMGSLASDRVLRGVQTELPDLADDAEARALVHEFVLRTTTAHTDGDLLGPFIADIGTPPGRDPVTTMLTMLLAAKADGSVAQLRAFVADFLGNLPPRRPFGDIVLDLLRMRALAPDVIADVTVTEFWVLVQRGPTVVDPDAFRLGESDGVRMRLRF